MTGIIAWRMIKRCAICGIRDVLSLVYIRRYKGGQTRRVYINPAGDRWKDDACYLCMRERDRKYHKSSMRENSTRPMTIKAVKSENLAAEKFRSLGFRVEKTELHGPDLICTIGEFIWTVEVKPAEQVTAGGKVMNGWRTSRVYENRQKDDLVAIVLPNDRVYIDSMKNHLSKCWKHGSRGVTDIVKEFGLNPLPKS